MENLQEMTVREMVKQLAETEFMLDYTRGAAQAARDAKQTLRAAFWQLDNFNALSEEAKALKELCDKLEAKTEELDEKAIEFHCQVKKIHEEIAAKESLAAMPV